MRSQLTSDLERCLIGTLTNVFVSYNSNSTSQNNTTDLLFNAGIFFRPKYTITKLSLVVTKFLTIALLQVVSSINIFEVKVYCLHKEVNPRN